MESDGLHIAISHGSTVYGFIIKRGTSTNNGFEYWENGSYIWGIKRTS